MVVPPPTSIELLKEHAIADFGYSKELEIYDYDYLFAAKEAISSTTITMNSWTTTFFFISSILLLYMAILRLSSRLSAPVIREQVLDLEAQTPKLSHSQTTTPSGSPFMNREFLTEFNFHTLGEDSRTKQS